MTITLHPQPFNQLVITATKDELTDYSTREHLSFAELINDYDLSPEWSEPPQATMGDTSDYLTLADAEISDTPLTWVYDGPGEWIEALRQDGKVVLAPVQGFPLDLNESITLYSNIKPSTMPTITVSPMPMPTITTASTFTTVRGSLPWMQKLLEKAEVTLNQDRFNRPHIYAKGIGLIVDTDPDECTSKNGDLEYHSRIDGAEDTYVEIYARPVAALAGGGYISPAAAELYRQFQQHCIDRLVSLYRPAED